MKQENKSRREMRREEAMDRETSPEETLDQLQADFHEMVEGLSFVSADDIPRIDLYMDQVLTFMEEHLSSSARDPEHDKILTKTMINNYVKNDVLISPVRKKYGVDHMILLLMIYYLKSYLSIGDIQQVLEPLKEYCRASDGKERAFKGDSKEKILKGDGKEGGAPGGGQDSSQAEQKREERRSLEAIYRAVYENMSDELKAVQEDADRQFARARETFSEEEEGGAELQKFALIARMSAEIYLKKLFIERLMDKTTDQ